MKRTCLKGILLGLLFILAVVAGQPHLSYAAADGGRTAADFLLIGIGARPAGMGGAYTAVAEGALAAYWNPAGLTNVEEGEVVLGHYSWIQDITLEHGTVAYNVNDRAKAALSVTYLDYGRIEAYDALGAYAGELSAYDLAMALSVGYQARDDLAVGLTGKIINQKLDDISGTSYAIDLGATYMRGDFTLAAVLANFGKNMMFESVEENLPLSLRLGAATRLWKQAILASVDMEKEIYGGTVIRHGLEFNRDGQYFVRTGLNYYPGQDYRSLGTGLTLGAGVRLNQLEFDYALSLTEQYSSENLHRFSLVFKFSK
jgi:hypothetical protein